MRTLNLVTPLGNAPTAMRAKETTGSPAQSCAVSQLIGASPRRVDVDSTMGRSMLTTNSVRAYAVPVTANPVTGLGGPAREPQRAVDRIAFTAFLLGCSARRYDGLGRNSFGSASGSYWSANPVQLVTRCLAALGDGFRPNIRSVIMTTRNPSAVSVFNFQSHAVRTVMRDGEPWFVATDVAGALGYATAKDAARNLSDAQRGRHILPTPSGDQSLTIINESGLYRLVLRSRKPEAVAFSDWVTGEVLPAIRKTGRYAAPAVPAVDPAALALSALTRTRFLCWFDDSGKPQLKVVGENACVIRTDDPVSVMTFVREYLPLEMAGEVMAMCAKRVMAAHSFHSHQRKITGGVQ